MRIPATEQELRTVSGIIYGILNRRNDRWYVGQTRHTFSKRYSGCKWWRSTSNDVLLNAYRRHGIEAFEVYILAQAPLDQLDSLERYYVKELNAVFPNGYCFEEGGQRYEKRINEVTKAKMSQTHMKRLAKDYSVIDPNGVEHRFSNIVAFAEKHGLKATQLSNMLRGKCRRYKGYHLPGVDLRGFHRTTQPKLVISPEGIEHIVYNAAAFSREHSLCHPSFCKVLNGKAANHRGWQLKTTEIKPIGYRWRNENNAKKRYERIILERVGQQYVITNDIGEFCATHGLSKSDVYAVTSGKQRTTHGFRLVSFEYTLSYLAAHPELKQS